MRMLALLTTIEPALLKRVKNFSCRDRGKGQYPSPFHFQYTAHVGACGKSRVLPHNGRPQAGRYGYRSFETRVLSTPADLAPARGSAADQYEERANGTHRRPEERRGRHQRGPIRRVRAMPRLSLSLIHISEPTRLGM